MTRTTSKALRRNLCGPVLLCSALALVAACEDNGPTPTPTPAKFTLHYHRALGDYSGWTVKTTAGADEATATSTSADGFGAVYTLNVKSGAPKLAFTLAKGSDTDGAGALEVDVSGTIREAWVLSGWPEAITRKLPAIPADAKQVAVYYLRADKSYSGWGLHLWGDQVAGTSWGAPLSAVGEDPGFGAGYLIDLVPGGAVGNCVPGNICLIVHNGDNKDPGPDMTFDPKVFGNIVFLLSGSDEFASKPRKLGEVSLSGIGAHLLGHDTIAWCLKRDKSGECLVDTDVAAAELRWSETGGIAAKDKEVTGGKVIALTPRPSGLTTEQTQAAPWLAGAQAFTIGTADQAALDEVVKGQIVAVARKADGSVVKATQVEFASYLDEKFAYDGPLGVTFDKSVPTIRVWAPTAQAMKLHVADAKKAPIAGSPFAMTRGARGVWEYAGQASWKDLYYRFQITVYHPSNGKVQDLTVTDPWAVNLDANARWSQIVDLDDPALKPAGWDQVTKPPLDAFEDIVIYESHIRDFSVSDMTTPPARRGKYLGFVTDPGTPRSDGLKHLAALADAGLTHVHLLPAFDIATVDEDPTNRVDLDDPFARLCTKNPAVPKDLCTKFPTQTVREAMATYPADSDKQQEIADYVRNFDSFNWGYDPQHYGAPEGSFASTAEGTARVLEFRQMVKGLADIKLRTVMDVVYNHTNASGIGEKAVLDKLVPGYYHRLNPESGFVYNSSCCANTASEHRMMERLIVDTMVRWARDYKVDGFRFDLMGLHTKANLLAVQKALSQLTLSKDGVDGAKIYLYGEGWDMGEMARNARGPNANQANMAGTGIGTFNDRIRDGARGGGPFDRTRQIPDPAKPAEKITLNQLRENQGFSSGLYLDPNELAVHTKPEVNLEKLLIATDLIKTGMAGGLGDFTFRAFSDSDLKAGAMGYQGQGAGYTKDPQESINYSSAHDNQILWDMVNYKLPTGTPTADRVRAHQLALDVVVLGQGIPFLHMGDDLLRSKSIDGNSYDSGDWFNRIDWTGQTSVWATGLPPAGDNSWGWPAIKTLFADATAKPGPTHIAAARAHVQEMLKIRRSSPLFRLRTGDDVKKRVDFLNGGSKQVPGVIVMTISDGACGGEDLDDKRDGVIVIVNADKASHDMTVPGAAGATLHTVLQSSADAVVKTAKVTGETFTVPARTTAVFELAQSQARKGLPCNTR